MKISIIRTLLLFVVFQNVILGAIQGFMRLTNGSIFIKSEGDQKWIQIKADISIAAGDLFRTSSDFNGSLYIASRSVSLSPERLFKLKRDGLYQKISNEWYLVSPHVKNTSNERLNVREGKLRGRLRPEVFILLTRPGQFKKRKIEIEFDVYHGDMIELPSVSRAEVEFVDGSQLQIQAGTSLEFGFEGIFLNLGSVFCTIQKRLSRFEVTTPNFQVAVRGTAFEVSHINESRVRVFEGVVKVKGRDWKGRSIFLKRGQQAYTSPKNTQILSSDFREMNRPEYSKVISVNSSQESKAYTMGDRQSELKALKKIQGKLRQSRSEGFEEFLSSDINASKWEARTIQSKNRPKELSVQDYLQRVANPGEDADFQIFKGGEAPQGIGKVVESWKDGYREEVQSSTILQRQKLDSLASDFKDRRELIEIRDRNLSVDLRTRVQQEDFNRRAVGGGAREVQDQNVTNREIINLRKFRNSQSLGLQRIKQDKLRLVRDKELIDRKIVNIERSLNNNPSQKSLLEATLSALRMQKSQLETVQKNLNSRESNTQSVLKKIDSRIQEVLNGFAGRFRKDDQFNKDSRRLLLGR